jgi:hypothetical protein
MLCKKIDQKAAEKKAKGCRKVSRREEKAVELSGNFRRRKKKKQIERASNGRIGGSQ